jgi:hypothetical protein
MTFANQRGTVLTFIVAGIGLIVALSAGSLYLTSTASLSGLSANDQNQAYHLAKAGIEYALVKNLSPNEDGDFTLSSKDKFSLVISGNEIKSTGIVKEGTAFEVKRTITVIKAGFSSTADINTANTIPSFTSSTATKAGLITTDAGTGQISLGKIGDEWKGQFGALLYRGSAASGNCTDGRCEFSTGFRGFFVFKISPSASGADGFIFTIFNGDSATNDMYSVGGDSNRGELLGYSGDSRINTAGSSFLDGNNRTSAGCPSGLGCQAGRGIQPPKIGVEFDSYSNYGSPDVCATNSRRDGNELPDRHHAGYVFWGTNDNSLCSTTVGKNSYDDNRHNNGTNTNTDPKNSMRPSDGTDPSYYNATTLSYNWLSNNVFAYRIEVTRSIAANINGNYEYTINSWIKPCEAAIACTTYADTSSFANVKVDYTEDTATLTRTIELKKELHDKFETFFFGWTMATGGATEELIIGRRNFNFKKGR